MKTRIHSLISLRRWLWLTVVAGLTGAADAAQTQTLRLDPGWNLIAFQVVPTNPAPAAVFGLLGAACERAFTYDNTAKAWVSWSRTVTNQANGLPLMPAIATGRAYWVYMNQLVPAWTVTGTVPAMTPPVNLTQGWNAFGVPVGAATLGESVNMLSVLAASGLDYDVILRWEQGLFRKFTPTDADTDDFTLFDANRGYWVNVKSVSFALQPKLLSSVRPDQDVEPVDNYPAPEDLRLSTSPTPLGPNEQTHIVFLAGEDVQQLALANTGGGILLWEISVTNAPWLVLSATNGVTTIENEVINLYLDRRSLAKGTYTATLTLRTTAGNRTFTVVANVPGLGGEWRGQATIATANGRHNPLPEVDLHLDFFEDPVTPGLVRGLIDSRNALLWPVDVPLVGHYGAAGGNGFLLSGGYVLPPGDVNYAPFGTFNGNAEDIDWNCNGKLDAVNPFPFPIYRSVTLIGRLVEGNSLNGFRLEGEYAEVIFGMMREPIHLQGTFIMRRESAQPFTARRPVLNQESPLGTLPVVVMATNPITPINLPVGRTSIPRGFVTDLVLSDVAVDVDVGDASASALKISLIAPGGLTVVLHDHANLSSLHGVSYPGGRRPQQSLQTLINSGVGTRGVWQLVVDNSGPALGHLFSWKLRLSGQPVFSLAGRVVDNNGQPLAATVFVDGLPFTQVAQSDANGNYQFARLPGLPLNFTAILKGYQANNLTVPGLDSAFTVPSYANACMSAAKQAALAKFRSLPAAPFPPAATDGFSTNAGTLTNPYQIALAPVSSGGLLRLEAVLLFGYAPLDVDFCLMPAAAVVAGTSNVWRFGDGSAVERSMALAREHVYATARPTGYLAQVDTVIRVSGADVPATVYQQIYPLPSPGNSPYAANFFQVSFTGGGTYPADLAANLTGTNDVTKPAPLATLLQGQHAYCASFDIDLAPKTAPGASFYTDGFDPLNTVANPANRLGNFRDEDYNYTVPQGDLPGEWLMAAECGYVVADDVFHPHPRLGQTGDCAAPRFQMLCNLGLAIMPATVSEVYSVQPGSPPVFPSSPDPLETTGANGIATSRGFYLISGPLAVFWKK